MYHHSHLCFVFWFSVVQSLVVLPSHLFLHSPTFYGRLMSSGTTILGTPVTGWTSFRALIPHDIDSSKCWKHSSDFILEIIYHPLTRDSLLFYLTRWKNPYLPYLSAPKPALKPGNSGSSQHRVQELHHCSHTPVRPPGNKFPLLIIHTDWTVA